MARSGALERAAWPSCTSPRESALPTVVRPSAQAGGPCALDRRASVRARSLLPGRIRSSRGVVISDLTNRAMVLLNYRLGDVATMLPGRCPCGRSLPMISFLEGRRTEWLQSTSGKLVHPQGVRELLRTEVEVWRYQVVQRRPDHFEIAVVTDTCDEERLRQRLAAKFAAQFSATTTTTVSFVTKLERTPQGKVRPVISLSDSSVPRAADEAAL